MKMKPKILVIEDDEIFCKTIANLLKGEDYEIDSVLESWQALDLAKTKAYDLIISDIRLPGGMDGVETVKKIKSFKMNDKVFVMMMTGYSDPEAFERAKAIGVNGYVYKPFSLEAFLTSVKQQLDASKE